MTRILCTLAALALTCGTAGATPRLTADQGNLALRLEDGRVLTRGDLVGVSLLVRYGGSLETVRIDGVHPAPDARGGPVALYDLSVAAADGRRPLCGPDVKGRTLGIALPEADGRFSFTCTSGARGKCVLFGYRPWEHSAALPMRDLHRACTHLVRADYGGDDRPTTRNGTLIDVYDRFGIVQPEGRDTLTFEAAWGPQGALCVAHPRIPENVDFAELAARHPRLKDRLGPAACSEAAMRANPEVLLFNASAP